MTEQDKQALIKHFCFRDCGEAAKDCMIMPCHEIELIQEFPTTDTDSDTISRQAAIDAAQEWFDGLIVGSFNGLKKKLEAVPPAQPERIKGHWIEIALSNHTYKCSVCGRLLVNITDGKNNVAKNYPYCHCGADMRGEQE